MALTQISTDGIKNGTITGSDLATNVDLVDNQKLRFGTGNDLEIYHDGTHSRIYNSTNNLIFRSAGYYFNNAAGTENMLDIVQNGAVSLYFDNSKKFETTSTGAEVFSTTDALFRVFNTGDGTAKISLHNTGSADFRIENTNAVLTIGTDETSIKATDNGSVELYHNNSKKFETTSYGNLSAAQVRVASSNASTVAFSVGDVGTGFYNSGSNAIGYSANGTQKWQINSAGDLNLADNVKGIFGDGLDLQIYHDGSNSFIKDTGTGNLKVTTSKLELLNAANNEYLAVATENAAVELYYDGSKKLETTSIGASISNNLSFPDNGYAMFGAGNDLQIYHSGTDTFFKNQTGSLNFFNSGVTQFRNAADNETLLKMTSDGSVELYYDNSKKLETTSTGATVTGQIISDGLQMGDSELLKFGSHDDLQIYHDSSSNRNKIECHNGRELRIDKGSGTETMAIFKPDAEVQLFYDDSLKFKTDSIGCEIAGALIIPDGSESGNRISVGNAGDLKIYHNGSNSYLQHTGTGDLFIDAANGSTADIRMKAQSHIYAVVNGNEVAFQAFANGAVELYFDDTKRLETVTDGAKCTGALEIFGVNQGVTAPLSANNRLRFTDNDSTTASAQPVGTIEWYTNDGNNRGISGFISVQSETDQGRGRMVFGTGTAPAVERMRINESGNVLVGTTSNTVESLTSAGQGVKLGQSGRMLEVASNAQPAVGFNRTGDDGTIVRLIGQGSLEGTITVSGSSVSYNGGHLSRWSQFKGLSQTDKSDRPTIYQGTVMSNLDDLCFWEGEDNQQLNMTKISDVEGDKDVAGVFYIWDDDDDKIVNDFYIAMTGDLVIRVAATTSVARGDLMISAGDGTAKPQADDIIRSSTIAKIISTNHTATYPDGSKAYPCVLMAC